MYHNQFSKISGDATVGKIYRPRKKKNLAPTLKIAQQTGTKWKVAFLPYLPDTKITVNKDNSISASTEHLNSRYFPLTVLSPNIKAEVDGIVQSNKYKSWRITAGRAEIVLNYPAGELSEAVLKLLEEYKSTVAAWLHGVTGSNYANQKYVNDLSRKRRALFKRKNKLA